MREEIHFHGHRNIQALHKSTLEVTKDEYLTLRGDCIIGVRADKACKDIDEKIKARLRMDEAIVKVIIAVNSLEFSFYAKGSSKLPLSDHSSIVIRKSTYTCDRTLAIKSSAAAIDIPRYIIDLLKDENNKGVMIISVE
jgi:hypothetical protein